VRFATVQTRSAVNLISTDACCSGQLHRLHLIPQTGVWDLQNREVQPLTLQNPPCRSPHIHHKNYKGGPSVIAHFSHAFSLGLLCVFDLDAFFFFLLPFGLLIYLDEGMQGANKTYSCGCFRLKYPTNQCRFQPHYILRCIYKILISLLAGETPTSY